MSQVSTETAGVTLTLTHEERTQLLNVLEPLLRDKEVEVHRTEAFDYREHLERQLAVLEQITAKLRRS
jgi:hypothetical protein